MGISSNHIKNSTNPKQTAKNTLTNLVCDKSYTNTYSSLSSGMEYSFTGYTKRYCTSLLFSTLDVFLYPNQNL